MLTNTAMDGRSWREEYGGRWYVDLTVLGVLVAVASTLAPLADPDLPMHLALGEWIVRHGAVPTVEPFAWTRAGDPYYAYSWLPETAYYSAYRAAGVTGLRILQGLTVAAVLAAIIALARLARWSVWTAVVLLGVQALLVFTFVPYLRPYSILLIAVPLAWGVTLRLLQSGRPMPWAAGLLVISLVAANSHLLFPITAAPWLLLLLHRTSWRRAALVIGATLLGWLLTPYWNDWPSVLALNFGDNLLFRYPTPIAELTPGVQAAVTGRGALLIISLLLSLLPWMVAGLPARERLIWALCWVAGLYAFALAARAFVLWWLVLLPLAGATLERITRIPRKPALLVGQRAAVAALFVLLFIARLGVQGAPWAVPTGTDRWLPHRAAAWADPLTRWLDCRTRPDAGGRALAAFALGSYLVWHHPELSYSIDSRNIFPDSVTAAETYVLASRTTMELGPWRSADVAIVPWRYPVASVLDTATGWHLAAVVSDRGAEADSVGLWVSADWWRAASDSAMPVLPSRLETGRAGVSAACG